MGISYNNELPTCPYCNASLMKFPGKKTKCKSCSKPYYPRRKPGTDIYHIVDEKTKDKWESQYELYEIIDLLKRLGVDQERINFTLTKFSNLRDAVWSLFNYALRINCHNFSVQSVIYWSMAKFTFKEGKDPKSLIDLALFSTIQGAELGNYEMNLTIISGGGCANCAHLNGRVLSIAEATKLKLLPHTPCELNYCYALYVATSKKDRDGRSIRKVNKRKKIDKAKKTISDLKEIASLVLAPDEASKLDFKIDEDEQEVKILNLPSNRK